MAIETYQAWESPPSYAGHSNWLGVDYVPETATVPTHTACHMHFSSMPTTRIPLFRLPTPKQFIGWIIFLTSPEKIAELVSKNKHLALNASCFVDHWKPDLAPFFFLSVPPNHARPIGFWGRRLGVNL
jgi:hypothetical protein